MTGNTPVKGWRRRLFGCALVALAGAGAGAVGRAQPLPSAESRAVAYLAREVPRWRQEHPCYSCHNNGDGTRALIAASQRGLIDPERLTAEVSWLRTPERWALNADDGGVKDLPLSRIQFATALQMLARRDGARPAALSRAAALVAADQRSDGSWPISAATAVGSPAGYGTTLATAIARSLLAAVDDPGARAATIRADAWLRALDVQSVLDASAVLIGLGNAGDDAANAQRRRAIDILIKGQARDGGWGPYVTSPAEPFDTALVMLAVGPQRDVAQRLGGALGRAREYLLRVQNDDGSWPETTRPAQQESYAQRVSTTAWALLALLGD